MAAIDAGFTKAPMITHKLVNTFRAEIKHDNLKAQAKQIDNGFFNEEALDLADQATSVNDNTKESSEMASLVTLYRQRREWEKKATSNTDNNFDQILDDGDVLNKMQQFFKLTTTNITLNLKNFLTQLQKLFADESDMLLVLKELLRRQSISKKYKAKLESAISYLEDTVNPKILKSGINVAFKARLFSTPLEMKPMIIRNSYRRFLEDEQESLDIYHQWIIQFGYNKCAVILEFMESALLTDMMALDPSCSRAEFGNLLSRLKQLNILHSTEELLLKQVKQNQTLQHLNHDQLAWFDFFVNCIRNPSLLQPELLALTGNKFKLLSYRERGEVLQVIFRLVMNIPIELFTINEHKTELHNEFLYLNSIILKQQNLEIKKSALNFS